MLHMLATGRPRSVLLEGSGKWALQACGVAVAVWAGFALSLDTYQRLLAALVIAAVGAGAVIVQLKNGLLGLAALVFTAVAFPMEFGDASRAPLNSSLPLAAFIIIVWVLDVVAFQRGARLDSPRVVFPMVAFMAIAVVSFVTGQFPWATSNGAPIGAQLAGLALLLASAGLFLAVGRQLDTETRLARLMWVFIGAGTITCITQTLPGLGIVGRWVAPDSVGSLFWTWMVAMCFSQAAGNRRLSPLLRLFLFCITAMALYRGLFQARSWVSGWLPPLIAFGVVLLFRLPRVTVSLALFGGPIGLISGGQFFHSVADTEQYSTMTRLEAWKTLWPLVKRSPLVGLGPSNYYQQALDAPILGWYVSFSSHNQYMDLVAQTGFLGLAAFAWFVFEIARIALRLHTRLTAGFAKSYVTGALAGMAGTLVAGMLADWIIPFYYNIGVRGFRSSLLFWVFLGGILVLNRIHSQAAASGAGARI